MSSKTSNKIFKDKFNPELKKTLMDKYPQIVDIRWWGNQYIDIQLDNGNCLAIKEFMVKDNKRFAQILQDSKDWEDVR